MGSRLRTRPHVSNFTAVVLPLEPDASGLLFFWRVLFDLLKTRVDVIDHPMRKPTSSGSVRIVKDQGERFCPCRNIRPGELWRNVFPFTGVPRRNRSPCPKS